MSLNKLYILILALLLVNCGQSENSHVIDVPTIQLDTLKDSIDTIEEVIEIDSFQLRLENDLIDWFDLAQMKEEIGFLEMGTNIPEKYRPEMDSGYHNYNYGAVGGLTMKTDIPVKIGFQKLKEINQRFISISTYKPWSTPQEKYYENNNEIIIGVQTLINYERLGKMNFVDQTEKEIIAKYGEPELTKENSVAYFVAKRVLILSYSEGKVKWFKCYLLNEESYENKELPENIFHWNMN